MENIIKVTNLTKVFKDNPAVDHLSFEVKRGTIFAFLGPNGAGKSTTIKMLTTLLDPSEGTILLNGFDTAHQQHEVRKSFGIVFQDPSLDDELTAYENMDYHAIFYHVPKELRKERIEYLLNVMELWDRRQDQVKTFSGGMKRRLEIARGLIHHPQILFLDEPTLGLDPQTRKRLWEHITQLNKTEHMTVFFTTHYLEEAEKIAHTIAIIDHGKIVQKGTGAELQKATKTKSLEEAFLQLTGHPIREESASPMEALRQSRKM